MCPLEDSKTALRCSIVLRHSSLRDGKVLKSFLIQWQEWPGCNLGLKPFHFISKIVQYSTEQFICCRTTEVTCRSHCRRRRARSHMSSHVWERTMPSAVISLLATASVCVRHTVCQQQCCTYWHSTGCWTSTSLLSMPNYWDWYRWHAWALSSRCIYDHQLSPAWRSHCHFNVTVMHCIHVTALNFM